MKAFTITTAVGLGLLILSALTIAVLKVEKQKAQIEADKQTIEELTDSLHSSEIMYLKCIGSVEAEQHGAHYSNGKIKFYKTK